jgi:hypothetical protein
LISKLASAMLQKLTIFMACMVIHVQSLILDNKHTQRYNGEVNVGKNYFFNSKIIGYF